MKGTGRIRKKMWTRRHWLTWSATLTFCRSIIFWKQTKGRKILEQAPAKRGYSPRRGYKTSADAYGSKDLRQCLTAMDFPHYIKFIAKGFNALTHFDYRFKSNPLACWLYICGKRENTNSQQQIQYKWNSLKCHLKHPVLLPKHLWNRPGQAGPPWIPLVQDEGLVREGGGGFTLWALCCYKVGMQQCFSGLCILK